MDQHGIYNYMKYVANGSFTHSIIPLLSSSYSSPQDPLCPMFDLRYLEVHPHQRCGRGSFGWTCYKGPLRPTRFEAALKVKPWQRDMAQLREELSQQIQARMDHQWHAMATKIRILTMGEVNYFVMVVGVL